MAYKQCPKRFEYFYKDPNYFEYGSTDDKSNMKTWRGNEFHKFCETFFEKLQEKTEILDWNKRFEKHEDPIIQEWIEWFIEVEKQRYLELVEKRQLEWFFPIANELKVDYKNTIDRTGHIDRIDQIGENELCIVEYKAGESYNMEIPDRLTSMNQEIGFYIQILKLSKHYPKMKITHWKVINPLIKKVWINKIHPITLRTVEATFAEMVDKITKKKVFKKKPGPLCYHCPYLDHCDPFYDQDVEIDFNKPI